MEADSIVLHCSATADSGTVSWDAIRRFHTEERGWSDIGYHYGIERVGSGLVIMKGRSPYHMGAHCKAGGLNGHSVGVCVVGEYDEVPPSSTLWWFTIDLLSKLSFFLSINPNNIIGHREVEDQKTCPGLRWDLAKLRGEVYNRVERHREYRTGRTA